MTENKEASEIDDEDEKAVEKDTLGAKIYEETDDVDSSQIEKEVELSTEESNEQLLIKIEELKDQLMRTLAESENLRKRTIKEIDQAKKYSHISFVRDLVSSVDNFKRALDSLPEDKAELPEPIKNLIIGLEIVEKEINSTFEKHNLKQILPLGEKFDYNFHQAMFEVPTNETEPGTVVEVSQKGYLLYDRLVRPAMVGISKKIENNDLEKEN
ncbi:nucleotide exchange factor GrpE [Pseudomonadota bacterium]|nr:nucleotide exchange factor GrpE [Pseudomonadota bacterium]